MDLAVYIKKLAARIGGQYDEYNENNWILIVPLEDGRYQAVMGTILFHEKYQKSLIELSSKVADFHPGIELKNLLEANTKCCHAKFSIADDTIRIEASAYVDNVSEDMLEEMILEVANTADEWEFRLTGIDVN